MLSKPAVTIPPAPSQVLEQLALVVQNSPDFIGVFDIAGKSVFLNAAGFQLAGNSLDERLQTRLPDYFVPEERLFVREVVLPAVLKEGQWVGEMTFQHFNSGARIPVLYNIFRIDDPSTDKAANFAVITRDLTEQKRKDADLRDAQQRVSSILATTEVGTWTYEIGPDRIVADGNLTHLFDLTPHDATAGRLETFLRAIHPDDKARVENAIAEVIREGTTFVAEYRIVQKDGSTKSVIARGNVERDESGNAVRLPGVILDITDRVKAETGRRELSSELERQARVVETVLSSIVDFAYTFDRDGRFVYVNKPLLDLWGLELKEAVGKNFFDLKYPEQLAAKLQRQIQQVIETRQPLTDETPYTSPTGAQGFYEYIFKPVFADDGSVELVAGSTRDISARKRAAEELGRSEALLRQLADAMPQIVWAAQPDGTLDYYNRRWFEYINLSPNAIEEARWDRYIHPDDLQAAHNAWTQAIRSGEPYGVEFRVKRADGKYRWFLVRALPIRDSQETITRWFGTCTDIQDQKELQARKEQLLESERAARSTVERASRMKDEFLATVSHELRTPLAAILGWTQLMRRRQMTGDDLKQGLETIERNARVQTQLIEDLLDMSRIVSGKLRLDVQSLEPTSFIEEAIKTVMPAASAKGIEIERMLDSDVGSISGDPNRMQQVVWNLLSNAIKFTPQGGKVRVHLARAKSDLQISVSDTGQGIGPEFLPHVFDRFRQADASANRKHGGLGLGLAIVRQLVELHGGTVRVKSDGENKGTTFIIELPLQAARPQQAGDDRANPKMPAPKPTECRIASLAGLKVLVVDDERDARELLKRVLEDCEATVIAAASANEALNIIQTQRPSVLVSDIGMAEVDGYEFLRKVRALGSDEGGKIPAIALTAFARSEDRTRALKAGYLAHLSKPVEPSELIATIAAVTGWTGENTSQAIDQAPSRGK